MAEATPAESAEEASKVIAKTKGVVRQWWWQWVWVVIAVFGVPRLFSHRTGAVHALDIAMVVLPLGVAVFFVFNRRKAARILRVNRERWGDV